MASRSLGTLTLDLIAKVGGFVAGMEKAERTAKKGAKEIGSAADAASLAWGSLVRSLRAPSQESLLEQFSVQ